MYFYIKKCSSTFCQPSILPHVLYCHYTYDKQCHYVIQKQAVQEMFKMSSAAAQKASTKPPSHKLSCFDLRRREVSVDISDGVTN